MFLYYVGKLFGRGVFKLLAAPFEVFESFYDGFGHGVVGFLRASHEQEFLRLRFCPSESRPIPNSFDFPSFARILKFPLLVVVGGFFVADFLAVYFAEAFVLPDKKAFEPCEFEHRKERRH